MNASRVICGSGAECFKQKSMKALYACKCTKSKLMRQRTSSQAEAKMLVRPITYHLEISQDSIKSEPVVHLESSTPFHPFAVGDKMSWNGFRNARWHPEPQTGQFLRVKDALHFIWDIRGSNIGHKVRLCVEICNVEDLPTHH